MTKDFEINQFAPYFRHVAAVACNRTDAENIAYGMAVVFKGIHGCGREFVENFVETAIDYYESGDFSVDDIEM